jgi:hypothetical protein
MWSLVELLRFQLKEDTKHPRDIKLSLDIVIQLKPLPHINNLRSRHLKELFRLDIMKIIS